VISKATIQIHLSEVADGSDGARMLTLPWTRPSPYRKREIIQGADDGKTYARPMPANARAILIEAFRDANRGLDELLSDPRLTLESLASREGRTVRSTRMTLSLAFLAPEIVKAAVEGRLPARLWSQASRRLADGVARSVAHARTAEASAGVRNDPPRSFVFRRRADLSHRNWLKVSRFETQRAIPNQARMARGNSNLGNGILRPETFVPTRHQ
jgi:hypothetical protein